MWQHSRSHDQARPHLWSKQSPGPWKQKLPARVLAMQQESLSDSHLLEMVPPVLHSWSEEIPQREGAANKVLLTMLPAIPNVSALPTRTWKWCFCLLTLSHYHSHLTNGSSSALLRWLTPTSPSGGSLLPLILTLTSASWIYGRASQL